MAIVSRSLLLALVLLSGRDAGAMTEVETTLELEPIEVTDPTLSYTLTPPEPGPYVNLETVRWTTPRKESIERLSDRWGLKSSVLRRLNPDLRGKDVDAEQQLVVYRARPGQISRSVGKTNRGRLQNGVPFPEGPQWALRPWRARAYGTERVVTHLMGVFDDFRAEFADAPPIILGELSGRRGGKIRPHSSHQNGHDIDIGYVVAAPPPPHGRWPKPTESSFDVEKNWVLIRGLLATGDVERIFVDARLQRLMLDEARNDISEDQLGRYFSVAAIGRRAKSKATIGHWKGHDDHMHVRFRCSPVDIRCDPEPRKKRSKRKRKPRKG
jgi:murein endopeptidase